jgi:hypothetical protein
MKLTSILSNQKVHRPVHKSLPPSPCPEQHEFILLFILCFTLALSHATGFPIGSTSFMKEKGLGNHSNL